VGSATHGADVSNTLRRAAGGMAAAAALISAVTILSRIVGFGRTFVLAQAVGTSCLSQAYLTATALPTVIFEVVAGGALASMVVPVLAAAIAGGRVDEARQTASALLTWVIVLLVPIGIAALLLAHPLMSLLVGGSGGCDRTDVVRVAATIFAVLAPGIVLYGIAVVCGGILQAQHRFLAPALAPLMSSLIVVSAYLLFWATYEGSLDDLSELTRSALLLLAVGTLLGVVVLAATTAIPAAGIRLRPTLHFPPGVAPRVRTLALAGLGGFVAQQLTMLLAVALANRYGEDGALAVYTFTWAVYLLPYAVLAIPIATSAFPRLAGAADQNTNAYAGTAAATTRIVVLVSLLGAALLVATALPLARVFIGQVPGSTPPERMAWALAAFAPGLVGFSIVAHVGRALYARGSGRAATVAIVVGWLTVMVTDVVLATSLPPRWTVVGLGIGNAVGMTVAAALLLAALQRETDGEGVEHLGRAAAGAAAAAVAGGAAGFGVARLLGPAGPATSFVQAVLVGLITVVVCGTLALLLDRGDLRRLLQTLRRREVPS
jgi:putative peptidoglycan lipid II flippase